MVKLATPVEGKTDMIEHLPPIEIGFRLYLHRVLDSFDRRISRTGDKTLQECQDEQQEKP